MGAAEPLRENEASEQTGREGPYLRHLVQGPWGGRVGRDEGASGSRKCERAGEPFQGEDTGIVGVGKKTKSRGGRCRATLSAGELSRVAETRKDRPREARRARMEGEG